LDLSLQEAFERALKYNLGVVESSENTRAGHALRLRSLNALLPNLTARVSPTSTVSGGFSPVLGSKVFVLMDRRPQEQNSDEYI
jgi:outer membrane protein TolC